jgi:Glycoside-hydrolase family GH114
VKYFLTSAALAVALVFPAAAAASYNPPPSSGDSWYWEISAPDVGLCGLPATSGAYPSPGSAHIWDTDLFFDSNTSTTDCNGNYNLGIPTGPSPVVQAIHAAGHYSVCYVNSGSFQLGWPDNSNFKSADYGNKAHRYQLKGFPDEWWLDVRGFKNYVAGNSSTLTGAAVDIATQLNKRFQWCKLEGQDAVEPDNLDGWTNRSASGAKGGGWGLTQAQDAGFERWIAYNVHADGLAVFQKNDDANASVDQPLFDGVITEECNAFAPPSCGSTWAPYLNAHKPVLNAEYIEDGETLSKFCPTDHAAGIYGALFTVNLDGSHYQVCWNSQSQP